MTIQKGEEIVKQVSHSLQFFETTDDFCILLNMLNGLEKYLDKMVVVPEEKWQKTQKDLKILQDIVWCLEAEIKELSGKLSGNKELSGKLSGKLEKIKALIENFPRCCLDGKHYCERDAWIEEMRKNDG